MHLLHERTPDLVINGIKKQRKGLDCVLLHTRTGQKDYGEEDQGEKEEINSESSYIRKEKEKEKKGERMWKERRVKEENNVKIASQFFKTFHGI